MSKKLIAIAIAAISLCPAVSRAADTDRSMFSFKGFGTLGVVHSSEDGADYVGNIFQPNGAGRTHEWDAGVDSKLGAQVSAQFTDKFSAIVQAVAQHQFDNSYRPLIEWANVKYQITPELSVRAGRIVLPGFLVSDSRFVGYAQPWIRPPEEVYALSSITSSDGGDITYKSQFGAVANTVQAFYGNSVAKLPAGKFKSKPGWGANDTVEIDAWTLRAGYVRVKLDLDYGALDGLYNGLDQFGDLVTGLGLAQAGSQAHALSSKYSPLGMQLNIYSLGASYDPGEWFAMAEYSKLTKDGVIPTEKGWYVTAGYRIDKFTPYVTLAQLKSDKTTVESISNLPSGLLADGATQLTAALQATLDSVLSSQKSASIGVRWDFMPSADLKIQYDRISLEDDTIGRLTNAKTGFVGGGKVNVVSAAIDFVF